LCSDKPRPQNPNSRAAIKSGFSTVRYALGHHNLLERHAGVLVGVSGGIDSMVLLFILMQYNEKYAQRWNIKAVHINEGFPDWDPGVLQEYLSSKNVQLVSANIRIHSQIKRVDDKCFVCSRARRKKLMEIAEEYDVFNIALAHHQEDVAETLLLNMFFAGRMSTLLPRQPIARGRFAFVRPLYYLNKKTIKKIAQAMDLTSFEKQCPYYTDSRREVVRRLLKNVESKNLDPYVNVFRSIFNVNKTYMP